VLDDRPSEARLFYATCVTMVVVATAVVCIPAVPLIPVLFLSQLLNAVLLLPLIVLLRRLGRDRDLMGEHRLGPVGSSLTLATIAFITAAVLLSFGLGIGA
jgi:Mn2+/Fe2+ NRAMP family transporter